MKKTPVILGISIMVLVVFGVGWWFWSLGGASQEPQAVTRLAVAKGDVYVIRKDGNEEKVTGGTELAVGDSVRTGDRASASIVADGRADVRLDGNTTVVLEKNEYPWSLGLVVKIKLQSGRIWSRVLKLLDMDQSFEAQSNDMVATVRGTAFGLQNDNGKNRLVVRRGGIAVKRGNDKTFVVTGGWLDDANGKFTSGDISSSTWSNDAWVSEQTSADERFTQAARKTLGQVVAVDPGLAPDDFLYPVQNWSESLHLWLAGNEAPALYGKYLGRKLYQIRDLVARGKSGMAYHLLNLTDDEFSRKSESVAGKEYRKASRAAIGRMLLSMADVPAEDASYRIKLKLEDMYVATWSGEAGQELYARALGADARLEEAESIKCDSEADVQKIQDAVVAADQSVKRIVTDAAKVQIADTQRRVLDEKLEAERLRIAALEKAMKDCLAPAPTSTTPIGSATSTSDVPTSTGIVAPGTVTSTRVQNPPTAAKTFTTTTNQNAQTDTSAQSASLGLVRIELYAQPNPANVGDRIMLYVKGIKADGSSVDVTSKATFSEVGGLGSLNGPVYLPIKSGSATLYATVLNGGQTFRATVSLPVGQTLNVLSSLRLSMTGGTSVPLGQARRITATAVYSSGYTQDVTGSVKFTWQGTAGTVSGSTFTADKQITGQVIVTGIYTEDGVTKTTDLPVNVTVTSYGTSLQ